MRTVICPTCSNPLPVGKPDPEWHRKCDGYRSDYPQTGK